MTVDSGLSWTQAQGILIAYDISNTMVGSVSSYNSANGALTASIDTTAGSGTYTSWTINTTGAAGPGGTSGTSGTNGVQGTGGTSGINGTGGSSGTAGTAGSGGSSGTSGASGVTYTVSGSGNYGIMVWDSNTPQLVVDPKFKFDGLSMVMTGSMYVSGTISASAFNVYSSGTPEISSATNLNLAASGSVNIVSSSLRLTNYTDSQTSSLSPSNGDLIYNSTTNKFMGYANGAWVALHSHTLLM